MAKRLGDEGYSGGGKWPLWPFWQTEVGLIAVMGSDYIERLPE